MKTWVLAGNWVVGAMTHWDWESAFDRAPVVLARLQDSTLLKVHRYLGERTPLEPEGVELSKEEWEALVTQKEAMAVPYPLSPLGVAHGPWLWLFRKHFVLNHEGATMALRGQGRLLCSPWPCGDGCVACLVADKGTGDLREAWASRASSLAMQAFSKRDPVAAIAAAETAFDLEPQMSPPRVALLMLAYRLAGREERAVGYLTMAERSVGTPFAQEVRVEVARLQVSFPYLAPEM